MVRFNSCFYFHSEIVCEFTTSFICFIVDYAEKLFFKECFAGQTQDSVEIPIDFLASRNNKFRTFGTIKLKSSKYASFKNKIFEPTKSPLSLQVVAFPNFTMNSIEEKKEEYNFFKVILNIILLLFIPRRYKINQNKSSFFSRMILCENNDIYENPAIEAAIKFRWQKAKKFFYSLFIRFLVFATCFWVISWAYLDHSTIINQNFLFMLIIVFYYLSIYQLTTEALQFLYRGPKKYFSEIFNIFDVTSIVFAVTIMTIMLKNFQFSDGFGSVKEINNVLIVAISFSIFLIWIELVILICIRLFKLIYI
jgi:hypothetical protein